MNFNTKFLVVSFVSFVLSFYLESYLPLTAKVISNLSKIVFALAIIIKLLNYYSHYVIDKGVFHPIIQYKIKPKIFYDYVKRLDPDNKYVIDDFTFQTEDGHNLMVFRLSLNENEKKKLKDQKFIDKPVLFIHGLNGSAMSWFHVKNSPTFHFLNKGYDVWVMNVRGNLFNYSHKNPNISVKDFFDYTFHIHGEIDIPTVFENIIRITKKEKITIVTNSAGTFYTVHSLSNELTTKYMNLHTERAIFTAPAILVSYIKCPYIKGKKRTMEEIDDILNFAHSNNVYHFGTGNCNTDDMQHKKMLDYGNQKYGGYDLTQSDHANFDGIKDCLIKTLFFSEFLLLMFPFQRLFSSTGQKITGSGYGMSFKAYHSLVQYIVKGILGNPEPRVYKMDYGKQKNVEIYGTEEAPDYNLANIKVPIDLIYGDKDLFYGKEGSNAFATAVNSPNKMEIVKVHELKSYYHITFNFPADDDLNDVIDKIIN